MVKRNLNNIDAWVAKRSGKFLSQKKSLNISVLYTVNVYMSSVKVQNHVFIKCNYIFE